jgi:hypothetical protein
LEDDIPPTFTEGKIGVESQSYIYIKGSKYAVIIGIDSRMDLSDKPLSPAAIILKIINEKIEYET